MIIVHLYLMCRKFKNPSSQVQLTNQKLPTNLFIENLLRKESESTTSNLKKIKLNFTATRIQTPISSSCNSNIDKSSTPSFIESEVCKILPLTRKSIVGVEAGRQILIEIIGKTPSHSQFNIEYTRDMLNALRQILKTDQSVNLCLDDELRILLDSICNTLEFYEFRSLKNLFDTPSSEIDICAINLCIDHVTNILQMCSSVFLLSRLNPKNPQVQIIITPSE